MEEDKTNTNKVVWQDFLNYLTRRFTNHEMHHFERKVDKSAFETEALDGLHKFAGASMDNDIELLKDHIHKRNTLFDPKSTTRFTLKNVAAIAIIVVISGVLISLLISRNGKMDEQLAQNTPISTSDSIEEVQMIAQQSQQIKTEIDKKETKTLKSTPFPSKEITSQPSSTKPLMVETVAGIEEDMEIEIIEEDRTLIASHIELLDSHEEEESGVSLEMVSVTSLAKADDASLLNDNSNNSDTIEAEQLEFVEEFTMIEASTQKEPVAKTIHPKKGDEIFAAELKQWLQEQKLENTGEIKIKLTFGENMAPKTASIINGINSDTDKAIQYYILKKSEWVLNAKNIDSEREYEYSFSL